jgi:hypothetical protein
MGHKGPVLMPRCTGPGTARTQIPFYSIQLKQVRNPAGTNFPAPENFTTKGCVIPISAAISLAVMQPFPLVSLSFVSAEAVHSDHYAGDQ